MRNPRVLCNIHGKTRPRACACIKHSVSCYIYHIEVMHWAWFQAKMLATVAIHRREWQNNFFYTEVIVKLVQLIDALVQNEELLCSKL